MKNTVILFLFLFLGLGASAINVSGTITSSTTSLPISNHTVNILINDSSSGYLFTASTFTNASGHYSFLVTNYSSGIIQISTIDCQNQTQYAYTFSSPYIVNMSICTNNTPCLASFIHYNDTINTSTVYFTNTSTGNPTSFLWSFGDGSNSNLQNPTHTYASNGTFVVTLNIGGTNCQSSAYDTIVINPVSCQADFSWQADTVNSSLLHFSDLSSVTTTSWQWNFGDGSVSSQQNPSHQFAQAGNYTVLLTINTPNCMDTISKSISIVSNTGSLVLYAYADSTILNTGTAVLYSYNTVNQTLVFKDSVQPVLYNGIYLFNFTNIAIGNYKLMIKLPNTSMLASSYYDTWFGNTFNWQNAAIMPITNGTNFQIIVLQKNTVILPLGNGIISGNIAKVVLGGTQAEKGVKVYLLKNDSSIITMAYSDSMGNFSFSDLPYGTYVLYPEITGVQTLPKHIILNSGGASEEGINFILHLNTISTPLKSIKSQEIECRVFPNPVSDMLNINLYSTGNNFQTIYITNVVGTIIYTTDVDSNEKNSFQINVSTYDRGVYFIIFTSDKIVLTKKFIKL